MLPDEKDTMPRVKRRPQTYSAATIRPYATAIGELALAWNDLHEAFGLIFVQAASFDIARIRQFIQLQAIWGCVTSDRQKRLMVEAAINWIGPQEHKKWHLLAEDVGRSNGDIRWRSSGITCCIRPFIKTEMLSLRRCSS